MSEPQEIIKDEYAGDITKGGRCDGSEDKPYEIGCIEDLVALSNIVNGTGIKIEDGKVVKITERDSLTDKYIVLIRNLNFKSKKSYQNSERTDFGNINGNDTDGNKLITEMTTGTGFRTIGDEEELEYRNFQGSFNGNNYTIKNLYQVTDKTGGLFGYVLASGNIEIKNLTLSGKIEKKINSNNAMRYSIGGIIGKIYGDNICKVENVVNYIDIYSEKGNAGGIVGINSTGNNVKIKNCVNYGKIANNDYTNGMNESAGGIIGFIYAGKITIVNCSNYGEVYGKDNYGYDGTGGIIGGCWSADVNVYNTCNYGKVEGNRRVGGIAGTMHLDAGKSFNFINVFNVGNVESSTAYGIGGVLGARQSTSTATVISNGFYASTREKGVGSGMDGAGTKYTIQQMKEQKFIDELNGYIDSNTDNIDTSEWKKWKAGENGFPIHVE